MRTSGLDHSAWPPGNEAASAVVTRWRYGSESFQRIARQGQARAFKATWIDLGRRSGRRMEPATPCSQSQIRQDCDLRLERTVQVEEASALSVVVHWVPSKTAVNGTLMARPPRMTPVFGCAVGSTLIAG
jgi:hypothetical protein